LIALCRARPRVVLFSIAMASSKKSGGDITTQILIQIRDEMRQMREEQRATNVRLDQTIEGLDRLQERQRDDSVRLATELVAVARAVTEVRDLLRDQRTDRGVLDDHERRLAALERRIS
jgi:hypothetical protein